MDAEMMIQGLREVVLAQDAAWPMGTALLLCLLLMLRGLWLVQRANAAEEGVLQVSAVVREVVQMRLFSSWVVLTLPLEDLALRVPCRLPKGRLNGRVRVTDPVAVLWRKGELEAVALQTIRRGQVMLVAGFAAMTCIVLAWVMLF